MLQCSSSDNKWLWKTFENKNQNNLFDRIKKGRSSASKSLLYYHNKIEILYVSAEFIEGFSILSKIIFLPKRVIFTTAIQELACYTR